MVSPARPGALGIALAKRILGQCGHVYVLVGDGECLEGTTWESLSLAREWRLAPGLEIHVDGNGVGALGDLPVNVAPGLRILFPDFVTYHATKKGQGVSFLVGTKDHKRVLTEAEYQEATEELK